MDNFNKINKMKTSFTPLTDSRKSYDSHQLSPKKQEWALINQYKALQFERLKQKQRLLAQQKKNTFRRQLDNQLSSKNNVQQEQVQADRKYYEFITNQAAHQKQREQRQKYDKFIRRRQVEQQNNYNLQMHKNSRSRDFDTGYHLDIGHKSEQQRRRNSQNIKKDVLDTLDQQLRQKMQQKQIKKQRQFETDIRNLQYQNQYHDNRKHNNKNFGQSQRVYQYYQQIDRQKKMRDLDLEYKLVDEAAEKKKMLDDERIRNQQMKKTMIKQDVKETLDYQVRVHNLKRHQETKINPEDYSYGVISNVFRQRPSPYDKNKYIEDLRQQVEEQKKKKKLENYMSEEEYRFNLNQLNKVVNGQYAHNSYIDRSLGTIGDNKQLRLADIRDSIQDKDAEAVKYRLENLRQRNNSHIISRTDRSI